MTEKWTQGDVMRDVRAAEERERQKKYGAPVTFRCEHHGEVKFSSFGTDSIHFSCGCTLYSLGEYGGLTRDKPK